MNREMYRILIAGEGGQGVQMMGHVLARAAFENGLKVAYMPNYGVEQRGGVSLAFLQIGTGVIGFPKFSTADIVVNMRSRAIERVNEYVGDKTIYVYDNDLIHGSELGHVAVEKIAIPATSMATEKLSAKVFNMIMLGSLISEIEGISIKNIEDALEVELAEKYLKKPQLRNFNKKAIELGVKLAKEAYSSSVIPASPFVIPAQAGIQSR